ncbi:hypothetical protein K470DRAFT_222752 [Piedraia hortae CBS 480.64]|uniref:Mediator of RNA polymerase II transcription subunit 8 n=1 Tax=Piedraia hortae CBS 480.64 TaxID=1314780 RepID=A0A6A7BRA0_9PEZI|nr:hypothetical protein K470DRAFT_222752 [Piedraia hortae CBS 480.64]
MAHEINQTEALNHLRTNLKQVAGALSSIRHDLDQTSTIPSWDDIQRGIENALQHLSNYHHIMEQYRPFFTAAHAYPLPTFPGHEKEAVLGMVMRKKLEPRVEEWVDTYGRLRGEEGGDGTEGAGLPMGEARELWSWAGGKVRELATEFADALEENFTIKEMEDGVENVRTGIRRNLAREEFEDVEEEVEVEEDEKKGKRVPELSVEQMLRFMQTGSL